MLKITRISILYNCSLFDRFGCASQLYVMATPDEIKIAVLKSDILTLENGPNSSSPSTIVAHTLYQHQSGFNSYNTPPPTLMRFWH